MIFFTAANLAFVTEYLNKIRNRLKPEPKIPPDAERTITQLPKGGTQVSVELALNSRCTSDYDDDPNLFHWGMFEKYQKLSDEQLAAVEAMLNIPRFTGNSVSARRDKNMFTFSVPDKMADTEKEWAMIESGMQQQLLGLICANFGVGVSFKNMGMKGRPQSDNTIAMIRIKLDAMKPSYGGSYWTPSLPSGRRRWYSGNLPEPRREGHATFLDTVIDLQTAKSGMRRADMRAIGQLLWAARGRTPHKYKSREWGMTIPTWAGLQDLSGVYYCTNETTSQYINWKNDRPTHHLVKKGKTAEDLNSFFMTFLPSYQGFIVLAKAENTYRVLWEIGYQLLNIILQASAWKLKYKAILLDNGQKAYFHMTPIKDPVAVIAIGNTSKV